MVLTPLFKLKLTLSLPLSLCMWMEQITQTMPSIFLLILQHLIRNGSQHSMSNSVWDVLLLGSTSYNDSEPPNSKKFNMKSKCSKLLTFNFTIHIQPIWTLCWPCDLDKGQRSLKVACTCSTHGMLQSYKVSRHSVS